jgi:hypothetical protein
MSTPRIRAEEWIRHLAWIWKHDDPCAVASEAAGIVRELLDQPDLKVLADHSVALEFLREVIGRAALCACPTCDCWHCRVRAWLHSEGR